MLPVFDVDDPRVMTSDELLAIDQLPESLAIVGGGVIGCEFAAIFAELGMRVTVVEMLDQLLPGEDRRAAAAAAAGVPEGRHREQAEDPGRARSSCRRRRRGPRPRRRLDGRGGARAGRASGARR